jgi:hypothetical protein
MDRPNGARMRAVELRRYTEAARRTTLQIVQHLDFAKMTAQSPDSDWSVAMVLDHLRQVDEATARIVGRLATKAARSTAGSVPSEIEIAYEIDGAPERIMSYPVFGGMAPGESIADGSLDRLGASRELLDEAIMQAFATDCSSQRFPHPVVGPMNAYEWILFVGLHETGHQAQVRRILANIAEMPGDGDSGGGV